MTTTRRDTRRLKRSHHAERAITLPRPTLRGVSHQLAAVLTLPLGAWLVATAQPGRERWACLAFSLGAFSIFAASGINHLRRWGDHAAEVMVRIDHTGIYLGIAGTSTAFSLLSLPDHVARIVIPAVGIVTLVGVALEWFPFASPRGFNNAMYLTIGWASIVTLPWMWNEAGPLAVVLLLLGGVIYSVGVAVVSFQKPNPSPTHFGYHEVWHAMVIAAIAVHAVDVAVVLR